MGRLRNLICILIIFMLVLISGCSFNAGKLLQSAAIDDKKLIKVEIIFTDDEKLVTYIKGLGIEPEGKVYVGGSSLNYFYDAQGKIMGSYNYQRVLYIKIIPEQNKEK